jgi:hypothetical protein
MGQEHIGTWCATWHKDLDPHALRQGSAHLLLMHAKLSLHSEWLLHSGRQLGGDPVKSGKQEHLACSLIFWQLEFGPQGEGWQGFIGLCSITGGNFSIMWHKIREKLVYNNNIKVNSPYLDYLWCSNEFEDFQFSLAGTCIEDCDK